MTERDQKNLPSHELQVDPRKPIQEKTNLTTINLPSNFPFQDLMCHEEHKEIFESLFGKNNLRS